MIGRITSQMTADLTLANITQAMDRLDTTQQQLSSGKKINQPSDDPYGTSLSLQLKSQLSQLQGYSNNVTDGTAWAQTASSALSQVDSLVQRVRELVVQASNGTNSAANDRASAAEVNQIIDAIKNTANTQYNGQYIFSGTSTQTAPYQSGSTDTYQGGTGAITRAIGPGSTVQVNADISQLLGSGQGASDGKLLDTLRTIAQDLQTGNTSALSGTDLTNLDNNFSTLTQVEANVGAVTDQLNMAASRLQAIHDNTTQVLSNTQDVDMAQAEIDFSTQQAAFQAALQAGARIVQTSLMNFLSN
jgi:flagellar hook-associated protein 3 FlgL